MTTKANELVDAKINYISFVKKGANGDPLRILKADETGQGIDLASLNKADDEPAVSIKIDIPEKQEVEAPAVDEEVIRKINFMAIGRSVRSAARHVGQGARAGYRYARNPTGPAHAPYRNLLAAQGHIVRSRAGAVGTIGGVQAGALARRVAAARVRGARLGGAIRARGARAGAALLSQARTGYRTGRASGIRAAAGLSQPAYRAGVAAGAGVRAARSARTWVTNRRVNGGGYWRRNA